MINNVAKLLKNVNSLHQAEIAARHTSHEKNKQIHCFGLLFCQEIRFEKNEKSEKAHFLKLIMTKNTITGSYNNERLFVYREGFQSRYPKTKILPTFSAIANRRNNQVLWRFSIFRVATLRTSFKNTFFSSFLTRKLLCARLAWLWRCMISGHNTWFFVFFCVALF